jgi:hypothetical protein
MYFGAGREHLPLSVGSAIIAALAAFGSSMAFESSSGRAGDRSCQTQIAAHIQHRLGVTCKHKTTLPKQPRSKVSHTVIFWLTVAGQAKRFKLFTLAVNSPSCPGRLQKRIDFASSPRFFGSNTGPTLWSAANSETVTVDCRADQVTK